jgi:hypothetical protein
VQIDLDQFLGTGNMDKWTGGVPGAGWTKTGTVAQDTVTMQAGDGSAKLSIGTLVYTRWARAGEKITVAGYLRGDDLHATTFRIRNLQTGNYGTAAGAWQSSLAVAVPQIAALFTAFSKTWTIEGSAACRSDLVQIEITFTNAAGNGWVDEVTWVPWADWASIHGHAFDPLNTLKLRSDDDPTFASVTDRATFVVKRRAFYAYLSTPVMARYWRVQASGTNSPAAGPVWMGELILGQSVGLATGLDFPIEVELDRAQVRVMSGSGGESAAATSDDFSRRLTLRATVAGRTAWDELVEALLESTQNGLYPLVFAPEVGGGADADADLVIFGRLANPVPARRTQYAERSVSLSVREFPFPMIIGA